MFLSTNSPALKKIIRLQNIKYTYKIRPNRLKQMFLSAKAKGKSWKAGILSHKTMLRVILGYPLAYIVHRLMRTTNEFWGKKELSPSEWDWPIEQQYKRFQNKLWKMMVFTIYAWIHSNSSKNKRKLRRFGIQKTFDMFTMVIWSIN